MKICEYCGEQLPTNCPRCESLISQPIEREITYEEKFDLLVDFYNWFADNPYHSLQDGVEDIISKYLNKKEDNNE